MSDRTRKPTADQRRRKLLLGAGGAAVTAATSPFWINIGHAQN